MIFHIFIMSGIVFGYTREAVRVKVKKCDVNQPPEMRKFSVDPQITSFEVLQSILAKAFDLKGDFTISFRMYDVNGYETYMPILSDWDLEAAFLKAHNHSATTNTEPCLSLCVDRHPFEECPDDWEIKKNLPIITQIRTTTSQEAKPAPRLHGIFNQMGKTLNMVQRAFNFGEDGNTSMQPPRPPLSDTEFRRFLDPVGQIVYAKELRSVIYFGGIDPGLRKVVWKHLLNVYPAGMTGRERMDYIRKKASEYVSLRDTWKTAIAQGHVVGELAYTTSMVRKDVLRTDRHHPFYAGSDDNKNIASLFNILTTYALNHPKVSYCQGMSDLASPLLVTMNDEAHAYICFCALMQRLCTNFMIDGIAMTQKFTHLAEGLMYYDPEFYNYLKLHQADDLLFCYRWLLLEMKREFAFEDSLRMLEVLWSSLPADLPEKELKLFDVPFQAQTTHTPPISPLVKTPRENQYTKICALRRQSSSISLSNFNSRKVVLVKRQNHSLDDSTTKVRHVHDTKAKHQSLDDTVLNKCTESYPKPEQRPRSVSPLEPKSDSVALNNRLNCESAPGKRSASLTNLIKGTRRTGHFKELKDKLATSKFFSSLDRLDAATPSIKEEEPRGKMVKNLNEFMNFAAPARNKISDIGNGEKPKIMLTESSFDDSKRGEVSPDDSQEYSPLTTAVTREMRLELENLDRKVFGDVLPEDKAKTCGPKDVFVWENPLHRTSPHKIPSSTPDEQAELEYDVPEVADGEASSMNSCEEVTEAVRASNLLPPPNEFGSGNPFLMFLCITLLMQHRDHVMGKGMDYNEMAMHFDKMVRKHNVVRVLNQARQMYARYVKQHSMAQQKMEARNGDC